MRDIDSEPKANNNNNNYNNNSNNSNNNFRGDAFKVGPRPPEGNEPPKNPNSISRMRTFDDFHDESERGAGEKTFVETLSTDRIDWWSIGDQSIEKMAMVDGSFRSRNERTKKTQFFFFFFVMAANAAELVFSTGSKDSSVFFLLVWTICKQNPHDTFVWWSHFDRWISVFRRPYIPLARQVGKIVSILESNLTQFPLLHWISVFFQVDFGFFNILFSSFTLDCSISYDYVIINHWFENFEESFRASDGIRCDEKKNPMEKKENSNGKLPKKKDKRKGKTLRGAALLKSRAFLLRNQMMMRMIKINWNGWNNCRRMGANISDRNPPKQTKQTRAFHFF